MDKDVLKIKMLGAFSMEYGGRTISVERNVRTKTNQLLQHLICSREGITREQLLHDLFEREHVTDPSNSLRALLFRLRKCLKEQGLPGEEYITISHRIYSFTPGCEVECDVYLFEDTVWLAEKEQNPEEKYRLLEACCDLYTGEFLPELGAEDWIVMQNVKYKNMYTRCVKELCEACSERNEYLRMLAVAAKAAVIYPFDGWQSYQMEALIALKRTKEAIRLYEETETMLFEELGVAVPKRMTEEMAELGRQVRNKTDLMGDVLRNLAEGDAVRGAYECAYPNFLESYRLVSRLIERTGQAAWLLLCTITDGKGYGLETGNRLDTLNEDLHAAIKGTLRRGDMFTRYSDNQYLILLMEIKQEDCARVIERINNNLEKRTRRKYIEYNIAPVGGGLKAEKPQRTRFESEWRDWK